MIFNNFPQKLNFLLNFYNVNCEICNFFIRQNFILVALAPSKEFRVRCEFFWHILITLEFYFDFLFKYPVVIMSLSTITR